MTLTHPHLVDQHAVLRVVFIVSDAPRDEVELGRIHKRHERRLIGQPPVSLRPELGCGR